MTGNELAVLWWICLAVGLFGAAVLTYAVVGVLQLRRIQKQTEDAQRARRQSLAKLAAYIEEYKEKDRKRAEGGRNA